MKRNLGNLDRIIRIVIGVALIAAAATGQIGWWGWLGIVPAGHRADGELRAVQLTWASIPAELTKNKEGPP